tara:strand:+ start:1377 stop:1505 length:129 start_codon:yes stop_codon:yes gene_type:complete
MFPSMGQEFVLNAVIKTSVGSFALFSKEKISLQQVSEAKTLN